MRNKGIGEIISHSRLYKLMKRRVFYSPFTILTIALAAGLAVGTLYHNAIGQVFVVMEVKP